MLPVSVAAGNQYSVAANLVNGAASGLSSVVGQMGQSVSQGAQIADIGMNALGNKANFWGGLGSIGGTILGNNQGSGSVGGFGSLFGTQSIASTPVGGGGLSMSGMPDISNMG